jgi:hypothetical protein
MTDDRSLERAARSWIEAGPTRAPDRVVDAALRQIDTTPQERGLALPWRFHPMTRFALAGAAVALATIVAVGLTQFRASPGPDVGGPSPSPTEPASAPASSGFLSTLTVTFESSIYRYWIGKDPDWIVTRATVDADSPTATDDNASDVFAVTGTDTTIGVTANDLEGQSFDGWLADIHQAVLDDVSVPGSCKNGDPNGWPAQQVGDKTGVLMTLCNFAQVFVEVDGQAYTFTWSNDTFEDASHLDVLNFKRALETVMFQPAPAPPPTPAPVAPETPLPDPPGDPLPASLIGRTYGANPPEIQGTQESILTLRPADDPHCAAMYDGQSTCFTYLWTPNYPKHVDDPAARGTARIVDGNLYLRFDLLPPWDDKDEGTVATYAIEDDGATFVGIETPPQTVPGFIEKDLATSP